MDDRRAQKIGGAVLAAALAAAATVVLFDGLDWRPVIRAQVYMEQAGELSEGAPVIVAGRDIGQVEAVSLAPTGRRDPDDPLEGRGGVAIHIAVDERYAEMISIHSEIFLERRGMFGRPYLAVSPPPEGEVWGRSLEDGDRLRGADPAQLDRVLRRVTASAAEARALFARIEPSIRELAGELAALARALRALEPEEGAYARAADHLAAAGAELRALADDLEGFDPGPASRGAGEVLARAGSELGGAGDRLDAALGELSRAREHIPAGALDRARGAARDTRAALAAARELVREGRALYDRVQSGRGTVGAILHDPTFGRDARDLGRVILRQPWRFLGEPDGGDEAEPR